MNPVFVSIASLLVALLALGVSVRSSWAASRSASAAEKSASVAAEQSRRARSPRLQITLEAEVPHTEVSVIYQVVNEGPDDLDSVTIHPPATPDRIKHHVAVVGSDWADVAELGPMNLGEMRRFTLAVGTSTIDAVEPTYRVRVVSTRGADQWPQLYTLDPPRHPLPVY